MEKLGKTGKLNLWTNPVIGPNNFKTDLFLQLRKNNKYNDRQS